jgi:hypothetical protein
VECNPHVPEGRTNNSKDTEAPKANQFDDKPNSFGFAIKFFKQIIENQKVSKSNCPWHNSAQPWKIFKKKDIYNDASRKGKPREKYLPQ